MNIEHIAAVLSIIVDKLNRVEANVAHNKQTDDLQAALDRAIDALDRATVQLNTNG